LLFSTNKSSKTYLGPLSTYPFVADELLVADGLVGLEIGHGAVWAGAVAEALAAAAVVVATLIVMTKLAVVGATRTL
jgi:hypothetical protein